MRSRPTLFAAAAIFLAIGPLWNAFQTVPQASYRQQASAAPITLDSSDRTRVRAGALTFVEGWTIRSPHAGFGGWSALAMTGPRTFLFASDSGWTARLSVTRTGAIDRLKIAPLPGDAGRMDSAKAQRDLESLARVGDGAGGVTGAGDFIGGFENSNRMRRYDAALTREIAATKPAAMARWSANEGAEAMTPLADGRWLVLGESRRRAGRGSLALVFDRPPSDAAAQSFSFAYDSQGKGNVADATTLPDGRVVILHRTFSLIDGFSSTIAIADPAEIAPDGRWTSRTLGVLAPPLVTENFEGIAVDRDAACGCIWIVSDDNLSRWQRTLLVRLRLPAEPAPAQKRRR